MKEEDILILKKYGWVVECRLPFEMHYVLDESSRATGVAAQIILWCCQEGHLEEIDDVS